MKKYLLLLIFAAITFIIIWDNIPPNPIGIYSAKDNINTIDTIIINKDGNYNRSIYYKKDQKLIFKNSGTWKYNESRIVFTNFCPNADRIYIEGYNFKSILMVYSVPLEKSFGQVMFDYDELSNKYKFCKL